MAELDKSVSRATASRDLLNSRIEEARLKQQAARIMHFVSLGMLILDDVHHSGPQPPMLNILGGAGSYAVVGARLFCNTKHFWKPVAIGFVAHAGKDFPKDIKSEIESWGTASSIVETPERLTTRGKNVYRNGLREFEFLTDKVQIDELVLGDRMLNSRIYHLICTPARCITLVKGVIQKRKDCLAANPNPILHSFMKPIFLWEPMEGSCRPEERGSFYEALKYVDIFSPNEHEMASLFNDSKDTKPHARDYKQFKRDCSTILALGFGNKPSALVVRMGGDGCVVATMTRTFQMPAYHTPETYDPQTFDVTGAGNTFMGGFAAGLVSHDELNTKGMTEFEVAAVYGQVASSFAIEQVGMPKLTHDEDGNDLWNGHSVEERLAAFRKRVLEHPQIGVPPPLKEEVRRKQSLFLPDGRGHKGEI